MLLIHWNRTGVRKSELIQLKLITNTREVHVMNKSPLKRFLLKAAILLIPVIASWIVKRLKEHSRAPTQD